jgi:multiple sugar transport system substrate-binding protein
MKKIISIVLLFTFLSCSDKTETTDGVTLTFWHSLSSSSIPALEELIQKFESENEGIKIDAEYIPSGNALLYKLVTAVQSNNAPDISWVYAGSFKDLAEADAVYEMEYFINGKNGLDSSALEDIFPALIPLGSWRGTLYSLPMEATNFALLYNRDMFKEAGLNPDHPPSDWNEFYSFAKKLTIDKNNDGKFERVGLLLPVHPASGPLGGFMVWQWVPFLWQSGGFVVTENQDKVLFNSNAGVEALSLWKKIFDELKLKNFSADHDIAFASKLSAMVFDGPWNLPRNADILKDINWDVAPLPKGPEGRATNTGGEFLTIFKQSEHPEEAWKFVKWIVQPENQAFWSMKSGYLPVRKSVLEIEEYKKFLDENPKLKVYVEQMKYARSQRPIDYHAMRIDKLLAEAIEKTTIGNVDPQTSLNHAAAEANKILQPKNF